MSFAVCACLTAPYDTVHATWRNNPASPESHNRHAYIPGNMPRKFVRITCPVSKVYSDTVRTATGLAKVPGLLFSASSNIRSNCRLPRMLDFDLLYRRILHPWTWDFAWDIPGPRSSHSRGHVIKVINWIFNSRSTPYKSRKRPICPYKVSNPRQHFDARNFPGVSPNALDKHIAQNVSDPTS